MLVDLPELEAGALEEFELFAPVDGDVRLDAAEGVPRRAAERVASELDAHLDRPYEALVVRRNRRRWSAGARTVRRETVRLAAGLPASSLELARPPDGEAQALADGAPIDPALSPLFADALAELEGRGRERFESFVVRADKVADGTWQLTIDPL